MANAVSWPLNRYLELINKVFDTEKLLDSPIDSSKVASYYRDNRNPYLLFYNRHGYMHMGLSDDGKTEDLEYSLKIIDGYIKEIKAQKVLELAPGLGANSAFLARRNREASFYGIDLGQKALGGLKKISNYKHEIGNYHDLSRYENGSINLVFTIESLCHSDDKRKVLSEVARVLKDDGLFIVVDGYVNKDLKSLKEEEKRAVSLAYKSMAVNYLQTINEFRETVSSSEFKLLKEENWSEKVIPTVRRLHHIVLFYFRFPFVARVVNLILPPITTYNSMAGLLLYPLVKMGIGGYYLHVLKKEAL